MAALWPASLQDKFNVSGFKYQIGNTVITSDVDRGPRKRRKVMTKSVDMVTGTIDLDYTQWITFYNFFSIDCAGGALPFEYKNPLTGLTEEFYFAEPPDATPMGGRLFKVSMSLEKVL